MIDVLIRGMALDFTDPVFLIGIALLVVGLLLAIKGEGARPSSSFPRS